MKIQLSKQGECYVEGYNINNASSPREMCKAFSYHSDNLICHYDEQEKTCLNVSENSELIKNDSNYLYALVSNNCGISGFFEPLTADDCKDIPLVDGQCCFVKYHIEDTEHKACLRTNEYQKKHDIPTEIINFVKSTYNNSFEVKSAECKGKYINNYFNIILIFLIFLI